MQENHSFTDKNILIVDDSKTNLFLLQDMLEDEGYTTIYSALSAKDAYKILEKEKIDIILLDVVMPDIDGIEACQTIRKTQKDKNTSIIMVTANDSDETLKKSFDAGANDFVTKPISSINLNSRMKNVFSDKEKDEMIQNQTRSAAMNEIVKLLTHQWQQPLADISDKVSKIKDAYQLGKIDKNTLEENVNNIDKIAQELLKTLDEIKNISKVDNKASNTDINKLVRYALTIVKKSYKSKKISLQIKEDENLEEILIYPNELVRVLLNIFINSQEAFLRNKQNSKKVVQVITSQDDVHTKIIIRDNAGGISDENISKIFNPYFTTKNNKNTTGLGLYSCKQIIEQHQGGKLIITSEKNITEISIELLNHSPYIENLNEEESV